MGRFRHSLLLVGLLSCRYHFDEVHDAGTSGDGPLPPVAPWAATFGAASEPTNITAVLEDDAGDLWVAGVSQGFGAQYSDGWLAHVDGTTGEVKLGGVRSFAARETYVTSAALTADRIVIAGNHYDLALSQQSSIGTLRLDGTWDTSFALGGALAHPGEYESIHSFASAPNNKLVGVGRSRLGTGGCTGCMHQTDGMVIQMDLAGTIDGAFTIGTALGDEMLERVVVLPDGDLFVAGASRQHDYSGGAGTNLDSGPGWFGRLSPTGVVRWALQVEGRGPSMNVVRASGGGVLLGGGFSFAFVPVFARVALDGTPPTWHEVAIDTLDGFGRVTGIEVADDGDLFISGYEAANDTAPRIGFVIRTSPDGDTLRWARTFPLSYAQISEVSIRRSRRGDLLLWASGTGADSMRALVTRVGQDGSLASCFPTMSATVALATYPNTPTTPSFTVTPITGGTLVATAPVATPLPANSANACSP